MSYDLFWNGDVDLVVSYREAYKLKCKEKADEQNYTAWLQGRYIYDALCAVSPVLHAFAKNGSKPLPYHKKPYGFEERGNKGMQNKSAEEQKMQDMISVMSKWAENVNKTKKKEEVNNG